MSFYDRKAPKKATNVTINADLLQQAKALKLNLSALSERAIEEAVRAEKKRRWQEDNAEAIAAYEERIETHGTLSEQLRAWRDE
ncbi:type II toxin-antitoxin system CcdA family antitoxin [Aquisalinus flavus]|nr:type II toxin-antitoxin system CcdA family antitoxin [Aquisalinus flavus]